MVAMSLTMPAALPCVSEADARCWQRRNARPLHDCGVSATNAKRHPVSLAFLGFGSGPLGDATACVLLSTYKPRRTRFVSLPVC